MLLALLAVEGVTILAIRQLLSLHVFIGLLLIPPVALKLAVTGYRFVRYYTRDVEYVRKGPPMLLMRMLVAPGLVVATFGVFASGVALLIVGPDGGHRARSAQGELRRVGGRVRTARARLRTASPADSSRPTGVAERAPPVRCSGSGSSPSRWCSG